MVVRKRTGPTAERYVETTLELIAERGSSAEVNLREISRRIGCAHTNAYNYFESREDLLWHALRRVVELYCDAVSAGLNDGLSGHAYFRQVFGNMIEWSVENPGLHRFRILRNPDRSGSTSGVAPDSGKLRTCAPVCADL